MDSLPSHAFSGAGHAASNATDDVSNVDIQIWFQQCITNRDAVAQSHCWQAWSKSVANQYKVLRWLIGQGLDDGSKAGRVLHVLELLVAQVPPLQALVLQELEEYSEECIADMALDNPRAPQFVAGVKTLLTCLSDTTGLHEEISPEALTAWISSRFWADSCVPEHPAVECASMGSWIADELNFAGIQRIELPSDLGTVLSGVLTRRECQKIIAETECIGYGCTQFPRAYRGNRRLQLDDVTGMLAAKIWSRIQSFVPAQLQADWIPESCEYNEYPTGGWRAVGCNTRFRFSKYFAGECFKKHADSLCCFGTDRYSLLTVNVYLNDLLPEQCGRTRFFATRDDGDGDSIASAGGSAGSLVIFRQEGPIHDGEPLLSGLKYLMRTDVIYEKVQ